MGAVGGEKPSRAKRLASRFVHALYRLVRACDGSAREPRYGWDPYLTGAFAPATAEVHASDLQVVEGALPADLEGAFVRIGPNPKLPVEGGYHWFDGDGMAHVVRIKGGKAAYCNRWVETARLRQEEAAGWAVGVKIGDYRGLWSLAHMAVGKVAAALGLLSAKDGLGTANTALAFHAGRLLALHEGDLPYALRIACSGLVETVGRATYEGKIGHAFTAHPKLDPETGELFYFGYDVQRKPYCWYGRLDAAGRVAADFPVPLPQPVMMHDMALTQRHALLLDVPLVFDPQAMVKKGTIPFTFEPRPLRVGVLPRYATSADGIRWFETDNVMCFHVANAWDEGPSRIRLFLCCFASFSLDSLRADPGTEPYLSEMLLDLESGAATLRRVPGATPGDFPVVPPSLVGRPTRYVYVASMRPQDGVPLFEGATKYDLAAAAAGGGPGACVTGALLHGGARAGGECFFAPRAGGTAEDDGYLLTICTDRESLASELMVYDAATMASAPVARVRLPQTVPLGFHCTWVPEADLAAQLPAAA